MAKTKKLRKEENNKDPLPERSKIRNIGIIAHIDAGKTTTTERILFYAGQERRLGDVDDGNTVTDWYQEEQERGITIFSTAVTLKWHDHTINVIDTPGHVDFTAEVERSLRVLDGAVMVFCGVAGVQAQSETVWRQAKKYNVPAIAFINKLDRQGADFDKAVASMETRLGAKPISLTIPYPKEDMKPIQACIDVIERKLLRFDEDSDGKNVIIEDLPDEFHQLACEEAREKLFEKLADHDDTFADSFLEKEHDEITTEEIWAALRRTTLADKLTPVYCGSSLKNKGVQALLDGIVKLLPSPFDKEPVVGIHPKKEKKIKRKPDVEEPFSALVFKTFATQHFDLTYLRVYSGVAQHSEQLLNPRTKKKVALSPIFKIYAMKREDIRQVGVGDIFVSTNLPNTATGDTLCASDAPILLETVNFPHTVVQMAIEPKSSADRDKMVNVLHRMMREDPTFKVAESKDTGQMLISGMGELHLEVILHRIASEFKIQANVGKPSVAYKESIEKKVRETFEFRRISPGGQELYASVTIELEPDPDILGVDVVNKCPKNVIPLQYQPIIEKSLGESVESGGNYSFPVIQVKATLVDAIFEEGKSNESAFQAAVAGAVRKAINKAGSIILEPIMSVVVETPDDYIGNVQKDLNSRRAIITDVENQNNITYLKGIVPIATMFGYVASLRAQSQGRATYSMEPKTYAQVPPEIQKKFDY